MQFLLMYKYESNSVCSLHFQDKYIFYIEQLTKDIG